MQRSLFLVCCFLSTSLAAQISTEIFVDRALDQTESFPDTLELQLYVNQRVARLVDQGYYFAGLDSMRRSAEVLQLYLHQGSKVQSRTIEGKRLKLHSYLEEEVVGFTNNGYPFAAARIDSSRVLRDVLYSDFVVDKGPYIVNDSAFFFTETNTNHSYIYQLIDHVPGKSFSQRDYRSIGDKIVRSPFLTLRRPVDISFENQKAKIYLDVEEGRSGTFSGILGLQQQSGGSSVIGNLDLDIQNLFRSGKQLKLDWERFAENSQTLFLRYKHPFLFGSKLSPAFELAILRQDSIFLTRSTVLGLSTFVTDRSEVTFSFNQKAGTLLTTDETVVSTLNLADYRSTIYKLGVASGNFLSFNSLNSDLSWEIALALGQKDINRNGNIDASFYDTLQLETDIFSLDLELGKQFLLGGNLSFYQYFSGGLIENDELLNNERYRVGGLRSLRGFNEKTFFADRFAISRSELRSFFERGSFLYLFYDQGFVENDTQNDTPFGFGLGFSLSTLSGQFSFALALGKSREQSLDFANMKIHFGYLTRF